MFVRLWMLVLALTMAGLAQQDPESALLKAAEAGDPTAQMRVGRFYVFDCVPRNHNEGMRWLQKAAEQGLIEAQWMLGFLHGVLPKFRKDLTLDYPEAGQWYRRAADQGDAWAQNNLGELYRNGEGVQQDDREAARSFRAAAEQGVVGAQLNLAMMYRDGRGVPQDYVFAYMWANLAAAQGTGEVGRYLDREDLELLRRYRATLREEIARLMTPDQIAEGQERARRWKPRSSSAASQEGSSELDSVGTAFWINRTGYLLTNQHVVEGCRNVFVSGLGGREQTRVIVSDLGNDLAVVGPVGHAGGFHFVQREPKLEARSKRGRSRIPLQGFLSSGLSLTTGTVSALAGIRNDTRVIQITAPVQPGNSGGPLLDHSGNIIGVVTSKLDALKVAAATGDILQNVNFAIKGGVVRTFLDSNGVPYSVRPSAVILETTAIAEQVKKAVAVVECRKEAARR